MKTLPAEIERGSMAIIAAELRERSIVLPPENAAVVMRCIHASADFDYAENLHFTPGAVEAAVEALRRGAEIVTDTNMALAGISRPGLGKLGGAAYCFMASKLSSLMSCSILQASCAAVSALTPMEMKKSVRNRCRS